MEEHNEAEPHAAHQPFVAYTGFADLEEKLEALFIHKAPFEVPESIRDLIVRLAPWAALATFLTCLPWVLAAFGISTIFIPVVIIFGGGIQSGIHYVVTYTLVIGTLVFLGRSIPGLFNRTRDGWKYTVYGYTLYILLDIFHFSVLNIIFILLWVLLLFQIKYKFA